jgi:hypothetical protein
MNFEGIAALFDYEIPIVPYSVKDARKHLNGERERTLRETIATALQANTNGAVRRAEAELLQVVSKYADLVVSYSIWREQEKQENEKISSVIERMASELDKLFGNEVNELSRNINSVCESCFRAMEKYITTSDERFWQGENYQRKKSQISECRYRFQDEIEREFCQFVANVESCLSFVSKQVLGEPLTVELPDGERVVSQLKNSIWEIWDAYDDYWFLDKDKSDFDKSIEESGQALEKAGEELSQWLSQLWQAFSESIDQERENLPLFAEYYGYKALADDLENFCRELVSNELIQSAFFANPDENSSHLGEN